MDTVAYIDPKLPLSNQMELINKNLALLQGAWESQNADKLELDSIYSLIQMSRKWKRGIGVGNTTGTYTGWTHIKAEPGYSIWKYVISDFAYNAGNKLYFDGKSLDYRGQASSEASTSFDTVFTYDGSAYTDRSTEAGTEGGTAFSLLADANDYIYIGHASQYAGIDFELAALGSGHTLVVEYSQGASAWGTIAAATLDEDTSDLTYSGKMSYAVPGDWATDTVNAVGSKYWIRIKTTTVPTIAASAYFLKPTTNVANLLSLSSTQVLQELWSWCSIGTSVYVTIRNAGSVLYEGDYYITSASPSAQKQNFFVYNHNFTADYQDSASGGVGLQIFANNAAAITGGLTVGMLYRTGSDPDQVCIVH